MDRIETQKDVGAATHSPEVIATPQGRGTDGAMAPAWVVVLFAALAASLVPWVVWLSLTLPPAQRAGHYRLAWLGFDAVLGAALAGVAVAALRDSERLERIATAAGVLLVVDAWFDITTSSGRLQILQALVLAGAVELPLASLCWWVASHAAAVRCRCNELLRSRGRADGARTGPPRL